MNSDAALNEISTALVEIVGYLESQPNAKAIEALGRIATGIGQLVNTVAEREQLDLSPIAQALNQLKLSPTFAPTFSPQITVQPAPVPQRPQVGWEFGNFKFKPNGELERFTATPTGAQSV